MFCKDAKMRGGFSVNEPTISFSIREDKEKEITLDGNFSKMEVIESMQEYKLKTIYNGEYKNTLTVKENSILTIICEG